MPTEGLTDRPACLRSLSLTELILSVDFVYRTINTNSRPTYRQILGYNNPILRQTPLTGGSLPAVVFLDLDYSICRLCLYNGLELV